MSGPVAITGLACHFAPETRNLATGGTATRYTGGKCLIDFPRPGRGKKYICEIRRLRPGKGRPGAWRKGKGQGGPGAAMAYLRRLHGDPAPAPVADLADADYDLADLALGPEGEQALTRGMKKQ